MVPARDFRHDLEAMAAAITEKTKMVFISNPYNPTGTIVTADGVARFMEAVPDRVIVVFDDAYYEYVDAADYPKSLDYVREGRNVCVLRTFSKIYALAGLRVGYGVAPKELAKWLIRVREPFNVNSIAQAAALASLDDPDQVTRAVAANSEGKQYLYEQFEAMGLSYVPTQANFIFVDTGMDSTVVFDGLREHGIAVRTGDIFGTPTYIRVTIGTSEQNERFIEALKEVQEAHAGESGGGTGS
jgi:histidinol-phosphate aminotransferase